MSEHHETITDADLHAYVDNQLDAERRARVEAYVAEHPEAHQRIEDYRNLNQDLRALFAPLGDEPLPERFEKMLEPSTPPKPRHGWLRAAAVLGWLFLGGLIGSGATYRFAADDAPELAHYLVEPAAFAHTVYVPEVMHPVEVRADQEAHLVKWLSKRLHTPLQAPDLSNQGFHLVGGRLLPSSGGRMAAQFMYEDAQGTRVTLYVKRSGAENLQMPMNYAREGDLGVYYWIKGSVGYALTASLDQERLLRLAELVVS